VHHGLCYFSSSLGWSVLLGKLGDHSLQLRTPHIQPNHYFSKKQHTKNVIVLYYFRYKIHNFTFSPSDILKCLKFQELFTSLQIVHTVAWIEHKMNKFGANHHATFPPSVTVSQPSIFGSVIARHSYQSGMFSFL
jgi:hypothetical protein